MQRRQALKWLGGSTLAVAGGAAARHLWLPPSPSQALQSVEQLAVRLVDSMDAATRSLACVGYDHPLRQYHNRGVGGGGIAVRKLDWEQRSLVTDLLYAGLSGGGRERLPNEFFLKWPGVQLLNVLICGEPRRPPYQVILTGPHLNLRLGGASREAVAFGGPQVYGDQRGNGQAGLPGNVYRQQLEIAQRLFAGLSLQQQKQARAASAPIQTQIELQGAAGSFQGISVATLAPDQRVEVRRLLDAILGTYAADDVAYAWRCLEHNGGIDSLFLAYYRDGEVGSGGYSQIFRLEGPAAVFYFRGAPHLHAFINVAMDGAAPLSVGELLGSNLVERSQGAVKSLFERSLCAQTGCDHAFYPADSVVGRLRAGPVRTGDIYTLENWQERIVVAEIRGADLRVPLDFQPLRQRTYAIATTGRGAAQLGTLLSRTSGVMLRDATVAYLRRHGLGAA